MQKNDYYSLALNDLKYLQCALNTNLYNNIAVSAQQVAEKLLKSIFEVTGVVNVEATLGSHNLKVIFSRIPVDEGLVLDITELAYLKDYYFEARYPGDDFVEVTKEDCDKCLRIMYTVLEQVNTWRLKHDYEVESYNEKLCEEINEACSVTDALEELQGKDLDIAEGNAGAET